MLFRSPYTPEGYLSSWAQYTIQLKDAKTRDGLQQHLKNQGIPSMIYYPRGLHQQTAYRDMNLKDADFPNTTEATQRVLSLPMHPYLKEEDVEMVCDAIKAYLG